MSKSIAGLSQGQVVKRICSQEEAMIVFPVSDSSQADGGDYAFEHSVHNLDIIQPW